MRFVVRMGVPEMAAFWAHLVEGRRNDSLTPEEGGFADKLANALTHLRDDPRHPGLESHDIPDLTRKYGFKIWQSYLENNTPSAGRLYWAYGPNDGEITILGIEPHPEDQKRGAYKRIRLSKMPPRSKR